MVEDQERDYAAVAIEYARRVVRSRKRHGKYERLACRRFLDDLKKKRWPYRFDPWHAGDVCDFIEKLPHVEGAWETPTLRLEDWQVFILANIFGWRRKSDGLRRFNTAYLEVARKNAKSTLSAGVALYTLACEDEVGPQVRAAATTGDQARIVFGVAKKMADRTPALLEAFGIETWANGITCRATGGDIKPINAKASTQDGLNPHCSIIDELHAHKDRALFDVLKSARGARRNPLSWYITTAGKDLMGVCYEQRSMVCKILEGVVEADHYFGIIYTLDEGDDWKDPAVWPKANPNFGVSVNIEEMTGYAEEAKYSPDSEAEFKTKRLNIWLNSAANWLSLERWDRCAGDVRLEDFAGAPCWVGVDLSNRDDITAVVAVFERDGKLWLKPWFWLPKNTVQERVRSGLTHYGTWAEDGTLTLTDGDIIDHRAIRKHLEWLAGEVDCQTITFDQMSGAQILASDLVEQGFPAGIMSYTARNIGNAALDFEARVRAGLVVHDSNPCLRWMASNCFVERRVDGSILPKKETAMSPNKIDGISAALMGLSQSLIAEEKSPAPRTINYEPGQMFL